MTMATILVTGGLGYIGAHMALMLMHHGYKVVVLDNNWHNRPNRVDGADIILGEISDKVLLKKIFSRYQIEGVMHFAGYIQVGESVHSPQKYYQNNVVSTITLLDMMIAHNIPYFIFSSTAAVYGFPQYVPMDEVHPVSPCNPYGTSKWMIEKILADYNVAYGLQYGVLRYFNAAGCDPEGRVGELHDPETHLIPCILQVASGRRTDALHIYGNDYPTTDGTCIRDYVHVTDLCAAHLQLFGYLKNGGQPSHFNLGTGKGYSVLDVLEMVKQVTGKEIPFVYAPRRAGDASILVADGTKAARVLQWKPKFSDLETLIFHAWEWEKQQMRLACPAS